MAGDCFILYSRLAKSQVIMGTAGTVLLAMLEMMNTFPGLVDSWLTTWWWPYSGPSGASLSWKVAAFVEFSISIIRVRHAP